MARAGFKRTVRRMRHRAARCAAPTAENGPGASVGKRQAQKWNRTQALLILRAGNVLITSRGCPCKQGSGADSPCQGEMARRARGGRVGGYEHEVLIRSRPRRRFGDFAAVGKVTRRPQAAKLPCAQQTQSETCPLIRHGFAVPPSPRGGRLLGGRFTGGHMGPPLQVERTDAIMCVGAGHWPARKRAADSRPYSGKRTGRAGPGPEKKSGAPVKNTGAPGQKQVKHTPPCCRFRPSGR